MIVDSSATVGQPFASADFTSLDMIKLDLAILDECKLLLKIGRNRMSLFKSTIFHKKSSIM